MFKRLEEIVKKEIRDGSTVDNMISSTMEELGEFCTANMIETGYKKRKLVESAKIEAIDLIICAFSLYLMKDGTLEEFEEIMNKKLDKWENKK